MMNLGKAFTEKGYLVCLNFVNKLESLNIENEEIIVNTIIGLNPPKIINESFFNQNKEKLILIFENILKDKGNLKKIFEQEKQETSETPQEERNVNPEDEKSKASCKELARKVNDSLEIISAPIIDNDKEINVQDFVKYFKDRFVFLKNILKERTELQNLTAINKLSNENKNISIIGLVVSKHITKNKNYLLDVEDLTGRIRVLIHHNRKELYEIAKEITLDEVIGIRGSGNSEIIFSNEIVYPEPVLMNNNKKGADENIIVLSDLHLGSINFLEEKFIRFIDWINGNVGSEAQKQMAKKVKYLFILGDIVAGAGIYPNQEEDLIIKDIGDQFDKFADHISKIRKEITIIIIPGNHDAIRLAEPQPQFDPVYAKRLYEMENIFLLTNPSTIKINSGKESFIFLLYHGYSIDYYYMNIDELRLQRAMHQPEILTKYLLKRRHLAPTHTSTLYIPHEKDNLVIRTVPDFFLMGHIHKSSVTKFNGITAITGPCWEKITEFQEKTGHEPTPCVVPIINLKDKSVKILDFN